MISVCIATYNGEKYLAEQLDSILLQVSEEDELIISYNISTDNTLEMWLYWGRYGLSSRDEKRHFTHSARSSYA